VIPSDQHQFAAGCKVDELVDAIPGIRPPVDDVAEDDDRVLRLGIDSLDECLQGDGGSVGVADNEQTIWNWIIEIFISAIR
jgi:hypothetical protein